MAWTDEDLKWMTLALAEAELGRGSVEPNPMVGAVVVQNGQLAGKGHHERFGGPHAEVMAFRSTTGSVAGSTLYVTLEPCCHFGKTLPCTDAILASGISRVVSAIEDPFPDVKGGGHARLRAAGLSVQVGCGADAARRLNAAYLKRLITGKPLVTAKWAMTLDGKTAVSGGDSRWISSEASRAQVHALRGVVDGILVGIGTVEIDDPQLTARPRGPRMASRIVLDSSARLSLDSRLVQSARDIQVIVCVNDRSPGENREQLLERGCEVIAFAGERIIPVAPLLDELGRRGMSNVLVEGGGRVLGSFLDAGEIDLVDAYIAPLIEGGDHARSAVRGCGRHSMTEALRLRETELTSIDGDGRIRGWLDQPWRAAAGFD